MQECEAISTRLAIMADGEFKCIGTKQHLEKKCSDNVILTIKVKESDLVEYVFEILEKKMRY